MKPNQHDNRESWLMAATNALRPHFALIGVVLPDRIRFSMGFPSTGRKGKRIGECWHSSASGDDTHEIYIRPDQAEPVAVLGILCHELVHAALPLGSGHGPVFKQAALAIGLEGKMRSALPGPALNGRLETLAAELGPLPHAPLDFERRGEDSPKKQGTRLMKAECLTAACGYTVRITRKWLDAVGAPCCPAHGEMSVEGWPSEGDDDEPTEDDE